MKARLFVHEWCVVLLFCLILLVLAGFAWRRSKPVISPLFSSPPSSHVLQVKIEGQISKPGVYQLPLKSMLKHLLEEAKPLPSADLSRLNGRKKLHDGQTLYVPERRPIMIYVTGAVQQPGSMQILSGTRYDELASQLQMLPSANPKIFYKKKGFVKEGESIEVPFKQKKS